jgi:CheY-like chemotaxis protein
MLCAISNSYRKYIVSLLFADDGSLWCVSISSAPVQAPMAHARRKILCIEDDRETVALIAEELIDRGFEVSTAYSGQEGLMAIMKATPDLVSCDISMPTMTDFEVLKRLNELAPRLGRIPFVFLTALADRDNELKGRRLGADD